MRKVSLFQNNDAWKRHQPLVEASYTIPKTQPRSPGLNLNNSCVKLFTDWVVNLLNVWIRASHLQIKICIGKPKHCRTKTKKQTENRSAIQTVEIWHRAPWYHLIRMNLLRSWQMLTRTPLRLRLLRQHCVQMIIAKIKGWSITPHPSSTVSLVSWPGTNTFFFGLKLNWFCCQIFKHHVSECCYGMLCYATYIHRVSTMHSLPGRMTAMQWEGELSV